MAKIPPQAHKVFEGVIFDVYQWEQEMFDGSKATFEMLKRPDGVEVVAQTADGKFILQHEMQPQWDNEKVSVPAGVIEHGESPIEGAQRELLEETGYAAQKYTHWFLHDPAGKIEWTVHVVIAHQVKKIQKPRLESGEKISAFEVTREEFIDEVCKEHFRAKVLQQKIYRLRAEGRLDEFYKLLA